MKKPPKVAIVCDFPVWFANQTFPKDKGHYAIWLTPLYNAFETNTNFEIHWVVLSQAVKSIVRFTSKNQFFHIVPAIKRTIALYSLYAIDRYRLSKELKNISPDLIHTWGTEYCYGLCGKDSKHPKWIHSVQGLLKAYIQRGRMSRFQRHHSFYETSVLQSAPYITTESPWAAQRVREINPNAAPKIWEYAVEDLFYTKQRDLSPRPSCLFCGNCTPIKNIDTLIQAFSSKELAHVDLYLAGPTKKQYPNLPANIHALGRQSREEVAELMSHMWCLVHLSLADTGPTAVKEARVMRMPVIISDECGSKQHIEHGKSGFVIKPKDIDNLINCVLDITKSKERATSMGLWGGNECRLNLSADTMVKKLVDIYTSMLNKQ